MSIPEPAVKRTTLVFTAGLLWAVVGLFLFGRGISQFLPLETTTYIYIGIGILLGVLKSRFIFNKIIIKNVERIESLSPHKDKICIFAFQAMESYLIAIFMVLLGIFLRELSIPFIIYGTILILVGTALLLSGVKYIQARKSF